MKKTGNKQDLNVRYFFRKCVGLALGAGPMAAPKAALSFSFAKKVEVQPGHL